MGLLILLLAQDAYKDGLTAFEKGEWEKAEKLFVEVSDQNPNSVDARLMLGKVRMEQGRVEIRSKDEKGAAVRLRLAILDFQGVSRLLKEVIEELKPWEAAEGKDDESLEEWLRKD